MISKYPVLDRHACIHEEDGGTVQCGVISRLVCAVKIPGRLKANTVERPPKNKRGHPSDGPAAMIQVQEGFSSWMNLQVDRFSQPGTGTRLLQRYAKNIAPIDLEGSTQVTKWNSAVG